jgi:hypothetical protein
VVILTVTFAAGRYSVSPPIVKTTEHVQEAEETAEKRQTHTKETTVETKKPDGTDTIVTTVDQTVGEQKQQQDDTTKDLQQTVTPPKKNTVNISVLGANDFGKGLLAPTYGLSVTKEVLGPVTLGAFGLMNGTVGISVGLDF